MPSTRSAGSAGSRRRLTGHGISAALPTGWEAEIYRRPAEAGEVTHPVLHAGTFPLPVSRGDFGSGAVDRMGPDDVFVCLFEHEPEAAGTPLFARRGLPHPRAADFSRRGLQRTLPGQSGWQAFFTDKGRAFCVYVVLGSHVRRDGLVPRVRELLEGLTVEHRLPLRGSA